MKSLEVKVHMCTFISSTQSIIAHDHGYRCLQTRYHPRAFLDGASFAPLKRTGGGQQSDEKGTRNYLVLGLNRSTDPQLPPRAGFFSSKWPLGMPRGGGTSNPGLFGLDGAPGGHFACFWL